MKPCIIHRSSVLCFIFLYFVFMSDAFKAAVSTTCTTPPCLPSHIPASTQSKSDNWTYIGSKGGIETYVKHIEGSNLLAFRGVAYIDAHISQAMGPFMNLSMSHEWVSMLKHIKQYPISNISAKSSSSDEDMVYQVSSTIISLTNLFIAYLIRYPPQILELPWPLAPRDVLMHRKFSYDPHERTVTINYRSVEDVRCPITAHRVRAHSPQSMWRFRSIPPCNLQQSSTVNTSSQVVPFSDVTKKSQFLRDIATFGCRLLRPISQTGLFQVSMRFINSEALKRVPQRVCLTIKSTISMPVRIVQGFGKRNTKPPSIKATSPHALHQPPSHAHNLVRLQCSPEGVKENHAAKGAVCSPKDPPGISGCWRGVGTVVEFESFVDSKAAVPAWFVNYMQR